MSNDSWSLRDEKVVAEQAINIAEIPEQQPSIMYACIDPDELRNAGSCTVTENQISRKNRDAFGSAIWPNLLSSVGDRTRFGAGSVRYLYPRNTLRRNPIVNRSWRRTSRYVTQFREHVLAPAACAHSVVGATHALSFQNPSFSRFPEIAMSSSALSVCCSRNWTTSRFIFSSNGSPSSSCGGAPT